MTNTTGTEPFRFTDADGDYLHIGIPTSPTTGHPAISFCTLAEPVHVPVEQIEGLITALRRLVAAQSAVSPAAVEPPADQTTPSRRTGLRDRLAEAIRDAACKGDCGKPEEECAKERIQPFVWHHGRLAVVEGSPEQFADAVLPVLYREWPWLRAEAEDAPPPAAGARSESCAHCGQPIRRVTGTLAAWWVHDPGGNTVCDWARAAASTRATPAAAGARQDGSDHVCNSVMARGEMDEPLGYLICGLCGKRKSEAQL